VPFDALDIPPMSLRTRETSLFSSFLKPPEFDHAIIPTTSKPTVIRREANIPNAVLVTFKHLKVVHVWLEVFDDSVVVS